MALPSEPHAPGRTIDRILGWLLRAICVFMVIMLALSLARLGLVSWFYSTADTWAVVHLGLDTDIARLVAVIASVMFAALLPTLAWSLVGRKQLRVAAAVVGTQAVMCALAYSVGKNVCFDRRNGVGHCYYAETPDGRFFSRTPGVDPKFGVPLHPFTSDVATGRAVAESLRSVAQHDSITLADRARSLAVAREQDDWRAEQERRARYLSASRLAQKVEFIVCAAALGGEPADAFGEAMVIHLRARGKTASSSVFSSYFVSDRAFNRFFDGHGGRDLAQMPVAGMAPSIILARLEVQSIEPGASAPGLITAIVRVHFRILSSGDGNILDKFDLTAVGAGTTRNGALSTGFDHILDQFDLHGI